MFSCAVISPLHADGLECLKAASLWKILKKIPPREADSQAVMIARVLRRQGSNFPLKLILYRTGLEKTHISTAWLSEVRSQPNAPFFEFPEFFF